MVYKGRVMLYNNLMTEIKKRKRTKNTIVDNAKFTEAIIEHTEKVKAVKAHNEANPESEKALPQIGEYIGKSLLDLCEGMARRPNFSKYSFRDLMIGDAIEDCIKAVSRGNFDPSTAPLPEEGKKPKKPNAFSYFSTCAYWAMVRRIQKEAKEAKGKFELINSLGVENFIAEGDAAARSAIQSTVNKLRGSYSEVDSNKEKAKTKHYGWGAPRSRGRKVKTTEPTLTDFMD